MAEQEGDEQFGDAWALLDPNRALLYAATAEPAVLRRLLQVILTQLMLIPTQRAGAIGGNESARLKPGPSQPKPVDDETGRFAKEFERCETNAQRLTVIQAAQRRLSELRYAPARDEIGLRRGTLDWKVAIGTDPREVHVVASVFNVTPRAVRRYRRRFRPDGDTVPPASS